MRVICSHSEARLPVASETVLPALLYGRPATTQIASAGAAIVHDLWQAGLRPPQRAVDLLSLALSVTVADLAIPRGKSPDGWTRQIELAVEVVDVDFWTTQAREIQSFLRFLTTDIWEVSFGANGYKLAPPKTVQTPQQTTVALLSGGADSLVGVLDLVANGDRPLVVSQTVHGDAKKQSLFATEIGGGLRHLQLNHNAKWPGKGDRDQRARSIIFLAYGVLAGAATRGHLDGSRIPLMVSENGLISVNPPLTDARLGALSTRTTHPIYMAHFQRLLNASGLRIDLRNPYQFKTKGEMFTECGDQGYFAKMAHVTTSCSRFGTFGLKHCGRCVPCMIRRAAFHRWGTTDHTQYKHADLSRAGSDYIDFDDVRSAIMALQLVEEDGIERLIGATLSSSLVADRQPYLDVVDRGLQELKAFLHSVGVR